MKPCRICGHNVAEDAHACPGCGAPYPAREKWDGWGYEYKSAFEIAGLPFIHISFKYRPNRMPVPAKGIIAIGQFASGVLVISQFGIGVFSLSQFTVAGWALAQIGAAYALIAQVGVYISEGHGQVVRSLPELLRSVGLG
jgi:hypothetical protein